MGDPTGKIGILPRFGYGTWQRDGEEAFNGTMWALEAGYRHIDTAQGYGNEVQVGRAIRESGLDRNDIFVTTKVKPENYADADFMPSVHESLDNLGFEPDLLLLHWPSPQDKHPVESYVGKLADCLDQGLTRNIGVSNFTKSYLDKAIDLLGAGKIATNQCEIHVFMQNRPIVEYTTARGIPMTAYSPLARGRIKDDPTLVEIGKNHHATEGQVALAFLLAEGYVVIPTSSRRERIFDNLKALDIELTDAEMQKLRSLDKGLRLVDGAWCPKWDEE